MNKDEIEALRAAAARPKAKPWMVREKQKVGGREISVMVSPEEGDELIGTVVRTNSGTSKYTDQATGAAKRYPIVEIQDADGVVWVIFGTNAFLSDLWSVQVGDLCIVQFSGYGEAVGSKQAPLIFKVAALRDGEPVTLSGKAPAPDGPGLAPLNPDDPLDLSIAGGDEPF